MDGRDPKCVHVDDNLAKANIIATWLTGEGIPAQVMNEMTLGGFEGLVSVIPKLGFRGAEVWIDDPADRERALELLTRRAAEIEARNAPVERAVDWVETACEECGGFASFPSAQRGSVQLCSKCGAYIDVPGDEENIDEDFEEIGEDDKE